MKEEKNQLRKGEPQLHLCVSPTSLVLLLFSMPFQFGTSKEKDFLLMIAARKCFITGSPMTDFFCTYLTSGILDGEMLQTKFVILRLRVENVLSVT